MRGTRGGREGGQSEGEERRERGQSEGEERRERGQSERN